MQAGQDMRISVLTVCRNAEATIARTIESFLAQDHPHKEMVLVDGASTDATIAIAQGFSKAAVAWGPPPEIPTTVVPSPNPDSDVRRVPAS